MERMKFQFELSEEQLHRRQKRLQALREHPKIQALLAREHLDKMLIERESSRFEHWLSDQESCAECSSIESCTHRQKGYAYQLRADEQGDLMDIYVPCRYSREAADKIRHRSQFALSHMADSNYEISVDWILTSSAIQDDTYVRAARSAFQSLKGPGGCFLSGQPGTGKTYLLYALANKYAQSGEKVAFVRVPRLMSELKENIRDEQWRRQTMAVLKTVPVLFLDDIGGEKPSEWTRDEILLPVLDERMNRQLKTYFSSNYTLRELEDVYACTGEPFARTGAQRLVERIRVLARECPLLGSSRRSPMA